MSDDLLWHLEHDALPREQDGLEYSRDELLDAVHIGVARAIAEEEKHWSRVVRLERASAEVDSKRRVRISIVIAVIGWGLAIGWGISELVR